MPKKEMDVLRNTLKKIEKELEDLEKLKGTCEREAEFIKKLLR